MIDSPNSQENKLTKDDINSHPYSSSSSSPPPVSFPNPKAIDQRQSYIPKKIDPLNKPQINHDYQLTRVEKELIRVYYREAEIKGFTIDQIPDFIEIKTKKRITMSYAFFLREQQYKENRFWYYQYARDSIAYVGAYRKAIDEIDQYKKELWLILMDPRTERKLKIEATKELHNLTKTGVLLMRDLPFITNLSKYYDPSKIDITGQDKKPFQQLALPADEGIRESPIGDLKIMNREIYDKTNTSIVNQILDNIENKKYVHGTQPDDDDTEENTHIDDNIMQSMTSQLSLLGYETDEEKKKQQEKEQKEAQNRFADAQVKALEKNLEESINDQAKLREVKEKYESSLNYLDSIVTPETRENIARLKELTDNKDYR